MRDDLKKLPLPPEAKSYARRKGLAAMRQQPQSFINMAAAVSNQRDKKHGFKNSDAVGAVPKAIKEDAARIIERLLDESFSLMPRTPGAKPFHVTSWAWRPIMQMVEDANKMFGLGIETDRWHYNWTAGLPTQEECEKLAQALEYLLDDRPHNAAVRRTEFPDDVPANYQSQYKANVSDVKTFIWFLRQCGGFEIE